MVADDDGKFFRGQSTAKDKADQTLNSNSGVVGPVTTPVVYDPLVVATPVATGTPTVGETLSCAEPVVSGGKGPYQIGYYWVDETNAMIWERQYQASQMVLTEDQIGKTYSCLVTVTDKGWQDGETVTVESNAIGPVVAPRLGITVTSAAHWSNLNDYTEASTVFAECANFAGGAEGETIYRYRWQTRALADGTWDNGKWTNYSDHALEVESPVLGTGQIRFQCQARDASVDPAEQVNSFTGVESITPLPTTIGEVTVTVLDQVYDWQNPATLTVLMNDPIDIVTTISGDASPIYKYTTRDQNLEYEIQPPFIDNNKDKGNGPDITYTCLSEGFHAVSISISDRTATDDGESFPGVQLWAVDAKTWAELQAKK